MKLSLERLHEIINEELKEASNEDVKELIEATEVIKQYMVQIDTQIDRMRGISDYLENDLLQSEIEELRSKYDYLKDDLESLKRDLRAGKFNGYYE